MSGIIAQNVGRHTGLVKAAAAGGEWTLIQTQTASSSATVDFTSGLDSTYDEYCFKFINIHPQTDDTEFQFNMSVDGGSNYNVTKTGSAFEASHTEADDATALGYQTGNDVTQVTGFQDIAKGLGTDNDQSASGWVYLFNPASTTFVKHYQCLGQTYKSNDASGFLRTAGYGNTTSAVDAVQFKMNSGNIDSGTISLFGIG
jgi:hypothetical protein